MTLPENRLRRVTVKEACAYARVGRTKLYRLIAKGKVDAYKDGVFTLVDLNSIDRYHSTLPKITAAAG